MAQGILFLLTSVITARFLEKHKMRVAAVLYTVMFTVLLCLFSLALDIPLLREAWTNVLGANRYHILHGISLLVVNVSFHGISVIAFIAFSVAVQLGICIYSISKKAVCKLFKRLPYCKFSRTFRLNIKNSLVFYPYININRIYCRMLN